MTTSGAIRSLKALCLALALLGLGHGAAAQDDVGHSAQPTSQLVEKACDAHTGRPVDRQTAGLPLSSALECGGESGQLPLSSDQRHH
jgi:hypothetical protein